VTLTGGVVDCRAANWPGFQTGHYLHGIK